MDFTKNFIRDKGPCANGLRWRAGGSMHTDGSIVAGSGIFAGDDVCAGGGLRTSGRLSAGGRMRARRAVVEGELLSGGNVHAEGVLRCASLRADGEITVRGDHDLACDGPLDAGYGVYAGTCVAVQEWDTSGVVSASARPKNLISGNWCGGDAIRRA